MQRQIGWAAPVARLGMAVLGAVTGWWGGWARFAPRSFFDDFPGLGHHWTAAYPPYNEHLVTDLGATFLTLAMLLLVAAALDRPAVSLVVLAGVLVFNALHLSYHGSHRGAMGTDYAASVVALIVGVVWPAVLVPLVWLGSVRRQ